MISKDRIREISNFMGSFIRTFEEEYSRNYVSKDNQSLNCSLYFAYKVTGLITGYLIGFSKSNSKYGYASSEQMSKMCSRMKKGIKELSLSNIDIIDIEGFNEILYNVRKANPEMTITIELKDCSVQLFVIKPD